jgi:hypothetical protein
VTVCQETLGSVPSSPSPRKTLPAVTVSALGLKSDDDIRWMVETVPDHPTPRALARSLRSPNNSFKDSENLPGASRDERRWAARGVVTSAGFVRTEGS